jgi:copper transport protein
VVGWLAVGPPEALAHANLVRSDPSDPCAVLPFSRLPQLPQRDLPCATGMVLRQPPRLVRLFFNERVDLIGRGVRVYGPSGRRVEVGPAQVSGIEVSAKVNAAEPGTYRVIWRVVASDTHPAQGTFAFSVGHSSGPPAGMAAGAGSPARPTVGLALQTLARALHFAGYAMSFGVIGFRQLVLVPMSLADDVSSERRVWRLVGVGVLALLIAEPLALVAQTTSLGAAGDGPFDLELAGGALDSSFGRVLAQRLGAAVLLWVLVGAVRNAHIGEIHMAWAVLPLGAVVALIDGEAAHAVGTRPAWAGLGIYMVHEAAMGLWLGGLLGLLSIYRMPGIASRRGVIVARTTRIAFVSVTVLIITGTVMALQHVTGLRDLAATAYGRTLLVKLCVLAAGLAIAWAAVSAPVDGRLRWWMREAGALLGLLGLAGLLVSLAPPV